MLPLLIGLMALMALVCGGVVNLSSLYLSHRALYQIADSAALAAVTILDEETYYQHGAADLVPTRDAHRLVSRVIAQSKVSNIRVESMEISEGNAAVTLAHPVRLPWPFLVDSVVIRARARAVVATERDEVP